MSFFYDRTITVSRPSTPGGQVYSAVASGLAASIQQKRPHLHTGYAGPDTDAEEWRILPDPMASATYLDGDRLDDDLGRSFLAKGAYPTPLGWQLSCSLWTVAGTNFPTRPLYILEGTSGQDATTGLPLLTGATTTLIAPAPLVKVGGRMVAGQGGAPAYVGEIEVSNVSRTDYPLARLLGAQCFYVDAPTGDRYALTQGSLEDAGVATWRFCLERSSGPRT
jgi:hypothetical protein